VSATTLQKCQKRTFLFFRSAHRLRLRELPLAFAVNDAREHITAKDRLFQTHAARGIDLGRLPNLWRRTWHTCKNGLTTDDEHRGGLKPAGERSNNSLSKSSISMQSLEWSFIASIVMIDMCSPMCG
jgi:hypothetical protein